jgi:hypothetical protein
MEWMGLEFEEPEKINFHEKDSRRILVLSSGHRIRAIEPHSLALKRQMLAGRINILLSNHHCESSIAR